MIAPTRYCCLAVLLLQSASVSAFAPSPSGAERSNIAPQLAAAETSSLETSAASAPPSAENDPPHFMDYLKFDGQPSFDVVEKTKEYIAQRPDIPESYFADDYCLRGGVIGPLTRRDLTDTQGGFDLKTAYPDITTETFGFTQDPENPYRCLWFEKWRATHTGTLKAGPNTFEATGNRMVTPLMTFYVVWNPEGKIVYESVGNVIDRHEGNTEGKGAVFGLLHNAGLNIPASPGSKMLMFQQRLGHILGFGRSFSEEDRIPKWWKSKSRGADPIDPDTSGL